MDIEKILHYREKIQSLQFPGEEFRVLKNELMALADSYHASEDVQEGLYYCSVENRSISGFVITAKDGSTITEQSFRDGKKRTIELIDKFLEELRNMDCLSQKLESIPDDTALNKLKRLEIEFRLSYYRDSPDKLLSRMRMLIKNVSRGSYLNEIPDKSLFQAYQSYKQKAYDYHKNIIANVISTIIEEIEMNSTYNQKNSKETIRSNKVFVVHGHDDEMKVSVARSLDRMGFEAIILSEQPDQGRTIIEKLENYSEVQYAVILLSPCDEGRKRGTNDFLPRARQNVIAEMGLFIGKLGRKNVTLLKKGDVEIPSDFLGLVYTEYDTNKFWEISLFKNMRSLGYNVDLNKLAQ